MLKYLVIMHFITYLMIIISNDWKPSVKKATIFLYALQAEFYTYVFILKTI